MPGFEIIPPGDDVGAGDDAKFFHLFNTHKQPEVFQVIRIGPPGALVLDVGKPLQLGRQLSQALKLLLGE